MQNGIPVRVVACPRRVGLHAEERPEWAPRASAGSALAASGSAADSEAVLVAEFEIERWVMLLLAIVLIEGEQAGNQALG